MPPPGPPTLQVIPPKGWSPHRGGVDLDALRIKTPIKQHVFGKGGAYVCILEEQRVRRVLSCGRLPNAPLGGAPAEALHEHYCLPDCLAVPPSQGMCAADFKRLAARPEHQPPLPPRGHHDDALCERAFWSGVANSPPLYGADTPVSLFEARLGWGWNLRNLGCMLQDERYNVPQIPGALQIPGRGPEAGAICDSCGCSWGAAHAR